MIATIGQPGLFPWWGTFAKIAAADVVVHLDHVTWQKGGYLNRFCLDTRGARRWSTIPLARARLGTAIMDIRSVHPTEVLRSHVDQLGSLTDAPYRSEAVEILKRVYSGASPDACETAIASTDAVGSYLGWRGRAVRSSAFPTAHASTPMLLHLLRQVGATGYLFGAGRSGLANHYLDIEMLQRAGIRVGVARYAPIPRTSILERIAAHGERAMDDVSMAIEWQ